MISWAKQTFAIGREALKFHHVYKQFTRLTSTQKIKTLKEAVNELLVTVGTPREYSPEGLDRSETLGVVPNFQNELPPRKMKDSLGEVLVPIGSDLDLRLKYINPIGTVRFGRILEDLDVFSVWVCFRHVRYPKQLPNMPSPVSVVTALVDHINVSGVNIAVDKDIKLRGHVSWVGSSSLETYMTILQENDQGTWEELIHAYFVMVARNAATSSPAVVNPLIAETPEEKEILERGERQKEFRKKHAAESLLKTPPTEKERAFIHDLYLQTVDPQDHSFKHRILPSNCEWMENCELQNNILCQPEERNFYYKIFGGYLMRQAFELSWELCYVHTRKTRPYVTYVDDIWFRKPVDIGSVLNMVAQIVYAWDDHIQLKVIANVVNPKTGQRDTTNVFYFTFLTPAKTVKRVIPKTYGETMNYLDGKRHYDISLKGKRAV